MDLWTYANGAIPPNSQAHQRLGRHRPWAEQASYPAMMVSIQESAMRGFLPGLYYRQLAGCSGDIGALIEELAVMSKEAMPHVIWNPLEKEEILEAYYLVIRALSQVSLGEADYAISHDIMQHLEERLAVDCADVRVLCGSSLFHQRCQHLFRALAEVSYRTDSEKLGTILLQFFSANASMIASTDSPSALGQWCYSILRTATRSNDRLECLWKVLRARPELPHTIRDQGRKGRYVADQLDAIASQMGRGELELRRHERLDAHLPPYVGDLRDGDMMDAFDGDLSGFAHDRDIIRGRHHRGGYDRRVIEERVFPDPGPNVDEQLALRAERSILLQEDQGRSMMQLTTGRNFGDRIDLYGMGIGETRAPRALRFTRRSELECDI